MRHEDNNPQLGTAGNSQSLNILAFSVTNNLQRVTNGLCDNFCKLVIRSDQ